MLQKGQKQKCGFIGVMGTPSSGKSTLVNSLVGAKVSIVSPKVQTTRNIIRGIAHHHNSQLILVDTPGIFKPQGKLEKKIVANAWAGLTHVDYHLLLVDLELGITEQLKQLISAIRRKKLPISAAINKIDLAKGTMLADLQNFLRKAKIFEDVLPISATSGAGLSELKDLFASKVSDGPFLYDPEQCSDQPLKILASEITREKLINSLGQELPYSLNVETESWQQADPSEITIRQVITVMRESQKKIVLGKGGAMIKKIGAASRLELEEMLELKVNLFLFVRVRSDWVERTNATDL